MTTWKAYVYVPDQMRFIASFEAEAKAEHALRRYLKRRDPDARLERVDKPKEKKIILRAVDGRELGMLVVSENSRSHAELQRIIDNRIREYQKTGQP